MPPAEATKPFQTGFPVPLPILRYPQFVGHCELACQLSTFLHRQAIKAFGEELDVFCQLMLHCVTEDLLGGACILVPNFIFVFGFDIAGQGHPIDIVFESCFPN